jgi:hypothetical protein
MSTQQVAIAIQQLKGVVLADPELASMVKGVKSPEELGKLWSNDRFRQAHDRLVKGFTTQDVRAFLDELSDKDLDQVAGGMAQMNMQFLAQNATPSQVYSRAFFQVLTSP